MKATGIVRNLDTLGRVVIPKEIRNSFNMNERQAVEIFVGSDESIVLKKYECGCIFCNQAEGVVEFRGRLICEECLRELRE